MDEQILSCTCGKRYKVTGQKPGKQFRCKECGAVLTVSEAAPAAEGPRRPRAGARRAGARRAGAHAAPPGGGSKVALWVGGGVVLVALAAVLIFATQGGRDSAGQGSGQGSDADGRTNAFTRPAPAPAKPSPEQLARQQFDELVQQALSTKTSQAFQAALEFGREQAKFIPGSRLMDLGRDWISVDAKAKVPNELLGNKYIEKEDRWVSEREYIAWEKEQKRKNSPFHKAARKLIAEVLTDNVGEKHTPFDYYYDCEEVPRPYLLAIEHDGITSTDMVAKEVGLKSLCQLYREFHREYADLISKLKPLTRPVPVIIFMGSKGYDKWRKDGRDYLPSSQTVAGFYQFSWKRKGRGVLHVWRFLDGRNPMPVYFHEGLHQLMDYYSTTWNSRSGKTPWFQEGLAEYWGGVLKVRRGSKFVYLIGEPNNARMPFCRSWASADPAQRMSLKDMVEINYEVFQEAQNKRDARSLQIIGMCYGVGWAMLNFCFNNLEDEDLRLGIRKYMDAELHGEGGFEKFAECLGIASDEDWDDFEADLADYITKDLTPRWYENRRNPGGRRRHKSK